MRFGNSSRLVRRRNLPTRVMRGSSMNLGVARIFARFAQHIFVQVFRALDHAAEFHHPELPAVFPDANLPEQDRPLAFQHQGERDEQADGAPKPES